MFALMNSWDKSPRRFSDNRTSSAAWGHLHAYECTLSGRLAENGLKPWRKDMWCIPRVDGEYVARMEDVLDLYAETPDPERPVVWGPACEFKPADRRTVPHL